MKILFGAIVAGIVAIAIAVLTGAGPVFAQLSAILGNL